MRELKPWVEEGAPEALADLLDAARGERPSAESLRKTLSAVGVGVITASTTSAVAGAASVSAMVKTNATALAGAASVLKWMAVGAGLGAAAIAATERVRAPDDRPPSSIASNQGSAITRTNAGAGSSRPRAVAPALSAPRRASPSSQPTLESPQSPLESTKSVLPRRGRDRVSASEAPSTEAPLPAAAGSERLLQEIRAIDGASRALASGKPRQALSALDDYDRVYPERRFAPEALFLRMEALLRAGRASESRAIAERLLAEYPESPQSARARLVLSQPIP